MSIAGSSLRLLGAAVVAASVGASSARPQGGKPGSPEDHLPAGITQLTGFGERASWSPDDQKIAFMEKSFGDAFEIDLRTRMTRLLSGRFTHAGFLRIQYLPSGDYFLIGARTFTDIRTTRSRDQEMWVMKAGAGAPPLPLGHKISEGVAISRRGPKIAWSNTHGQYPDLLAEGESVIYVADLVYPDGVPTLTGKKEVLRARAPECTLEAQDFRHDDTELIYTCYRSPFADVLGVELATGKVTVYRKIADEYNEVEGVSPDGRWALVESSRGQGGPERQNSRFIDLWKLPLTAGATVFERLTRWGDYEGYKASNPVVSHDGRRIAFQSARNDEPAGVGHGLFLLDVK